MKSAIKILAFGASSKNVAQTYAKDAYLLGQLIAGKGWSCINGAGSGGLMRAISDGTIDGGGKAIGIIPQFMVDNGWNYPRLTETIITTDMHQRKEKMTQLADAIVAMPGGCGTWEELFEVITWRQLNIISKPIVLLNTGNYYAPIIEMFRQGIREHFLLKSHANLFSVATTPIEAISLIEDELKQDITVVESKY